MTKIAYQVGETRSEITWAASEYFGELLEKEWWLGEMEAVKIDQIENLSNVAKLLLSAVTGAIIQRLLDVGTEPKQIFSNGVFIIKEDK